MFTKTTSQKFLVRQDLTNMQRSALSRTENVCSHRFTISLVGIFLFLAVTMCTLVFPVSAYSSPDSIVAAGKVYVSGVTYDPGSFFVNDKGTVTVYVTNGNANQSIVVNHATIGDKNIRLTSGTYDTSAQIGPLQTQSFIFTVETTALEGPYFPTFSLSLRDADSLYYQTTVYVDNTPLIVTVLNKPDTFTDGKKESITVQIANPRKNSVKNVVLDATGDGISTTPSKLYIGTLKSGDSTNVTFTATPNKETPLNITVNYDNGDNHHSVGLTVPVTFDTDKKKAAPQTSNVKVKLESGVYHITGDVTNAGLTTANGVTVTSLSPATPQDPYKSYVIGALKADDFGSFEVTFNANGATSIPLQISYKDTDGNIVTSQQDVSISGVSDTSASQQTGNPLLPAIGIVLVIAIGGWYLYSKRRKNQ